MAEKKLSMKADLAWHKQRLRQAEKEARDNRDIADYNARYRDDYKRMLSTLVVWNVIVLTALVLACFMWYSFR